MSGTLLGLCGIAISIVFLGTNYVPVKKYRTYDGVLFQWYQSSGTAVVGLVLAIIVDWNWATGLAVPWEGLTGGVIYSVVVAMFPMVCFIILFIICLLWCHSKTKANIICVCVV